MVNELGDLQLAGWWVGQSSLRVTAGYERERTERLDEAREPEAVTKGYRRTTECSTHAVFWAVGVVPRDLKSLRSSEKLTSKLTPCATSWTDFRRSLLLASGWGTHSTQKNQDLLN